MKLPCILILCVSSLHAATGKDIKGAMAMTCDELLARHTKDHRSYFDRVFIRLGDDKEEAGSTDQRLVDFKNGKPDPSLAALYFRLMPIPR